MPNKSFQFSNCALISTVTAIAVGSIVLAILFKRFQKPKPNVYFFLLNLFILSICLL